MAVATGIAPTALMAEPDTMLATMIDIILTTRTANNT